MVTEEHVKSWEALSREARALAVRERDQCPICKGGLFLYDEADRYTECPCFGARVFESEFHKVVPQGYVHMATGLKPSEKSEASLGFQEKVIALLKSRPKASFAFFGPAGVGKTSLEIWLLIQALYGYHVRGERCAPVRSSASALVDAYHDWITDDTGDVPEPRITTRNRIVFLAELEKIGHMTEYRYKVLFEIIDSLYDRRPRCQLVIDTNLSRGDFQEHFTDKIARRVTELCYRIDYFTSEILEPTEESMR